MECATIEILLQLILFQLPNRLVLDRFGNDNDLYLNRFGIRNIGYILLRINLLFHY